MTSHKKGGKGKNLAYMCSQGTVTIAYPLLSIKLFKQQSDEKSESTYKVRWRIVRCKNYKWSKFCRSGSMRCRQAVFISYVPETFVCVCVLACTHCYQCWLSWGQGHHWHHPQWRPPPTLPSGSLPQCVASGWVKCVQRQSPGTQWESHPPSHHSSPARTREHGWLTHANVLCMYFYFTFVNSVWVLTVFPRGYRIHVWVTNSPLIPSHVQQ